jgi:hypothetical protein
MMPRAILPAVCLLLACVFGCGEGSSSSTKAGVTPPHNGQIFPMPEGRGLVEVVSETTAQPSRRRADSRLIAYFLQADGAPLSPAPTDVKLTFNQGGKSKTVDLAPKSDGASAGGFATPSGQYVTSEGLTGEIAANLGGQAVRVPISIR